MMPSSALRPFGHQPPWRTPWAIAQSSAARSAPVWPPATILNGDLCIDCSPVAFIPHSHDDSRTHPSPGRDQIGIVRLTPFKPCFPDWIVVERTETVLRLQPTQSNSLKHVP